jgi:L-asparagine transporter-like permease
VDSRTLFSLARGGYAPASLGKLTAAGAPLRALLVSSFGVIVALAMEKWAPRNAFVYILGAALFGAMLAWLAALAAHVRFRARLPTEALSALPIRSPAGATASVAGFVGIVIGIGATWWVSRVTVLSGLVYLVVLTIAYFFMRPRASSMA